MGRRKLTKEYAIRLVHPEIGEYYFNYINTGGYYETKTDAIFTQTLSKVRKWKTLKTVEEQILTITNELKSKKLKIFIPITNDARENFSDDIKNKMICNRKKYYYPIEKVISKHHINAARNNVNRLNETLLCDTKMISEMIEKSEHLEKDFMKIIKKLENDLNTYRKDHSFLDKNKDVDIAHLDIVDASYGFRYLKLKTLREFVVDESESEL